MDLQSSNEDLQSLEKCLSVGQPLPKLTHIDPVIFVLAQQDFSQPPEQPSLDRVERVERMLEAIDTYQHEVRANFHHLVSKEKRRIEQSCSLYEQTQKHKPESGPGIHHEDARSMVAAMSAPIDPETDYNVEGPAQGVKFWELFHGDEEPLNRENSLRQLGLVAEQGVHHIDEFSSIFMANLRAKWEAILDRERRALEGFMGADKPMMDCPDL